MNKKQLIVAWVMGVLIGAWFVVACIIADEITNIEGFFSIVVPILIIGSLLGCTVRDKKSEQMNKKQLIVAWVMGVLTSAWFVIVFGIADGIPKMCGFFSTFFSTVIPVLIIGGLLIYTLRDKESRSMNKKQLIVVWAMGILISISSVIAFGIVDKVIDVEAFLFVVVLLSFISSLFINILGDEESESRRANSINIKKTKKDEKDKNKRRL